MKYPYSSRPSRRLVRCRRTAALALVLATFSVPWVARPAAAADGPRAEVPVESFELDNGMKFLVVERPEMATLAAAWVVKVGSANERPGITGLAHLFEHMMFKGTTTIGTKDAAKDFEIIAAQERVQSQMRAIYGDLRAAWRRGEIEDPYDPAVRPPELVELQAEFDELVEAQREIMVKDEYDQIYSENGSSFLNAATNRDATVYMNSLPANKAELWFWMESDRLLDPVFREFYSERDVVYEERRLRTEATPTGEFEEMVTSMFWQSHPYSWPVVGWPSDLRMISKAQADEFYATYYAPNNITAVLVGPIEAAEAKRLAKKYFERLPRGEREPPDVVTLEMEQRAEKRMTAECDCQPQIQIRYHTVPFVHRDSYALDVLTAVLNERTGRLYKEMIEGREIASSASATQVAGKFAGVTTFRAEAKGDATPALLEAAWDAVIADLRENPVGDEELRRVKNGLLADTFRSLENPFFVMIQLAFYEGLGDWTYLNTMAERTEAVTAEDVQRVAQTYFEPENRIVAHYTRKAGSVQQEIPEELRDLPPAARQQILGQLGQLQSMTDTGQLQTIRQQLEGQIGGAPEEFRPAMELMLRRLTERIEELERGGTESDEQSEGGDGR